MLPSQAHRLVALLAVIVVCTVTKVPTTPEYSSLVDQLVTGDETVSVPGHGFWHRVSCALAPWLQPCSPATSWYLYSGTVQLPAAIVRAFGIRSPETGNTVHSLGTNRMLEAGRSILSLTGIHERDALYLFVMNATYFNYFSVRVS